MDTTKSDVGAHGEASRTAPTSSDLRDTLTCIAQLAQLIVNVSDRKSTHARDDVMAQPTRKVAVPAKPRVQVPAEQRNRKPGGATAATPLGALEATFDSLYEIIPNVKEHSGATLAGVLPASMLDDKLGDIVQPIEEAIIKVAWQTSETTCQSLDDVRIKAKILKCIASDEPGDIESALTLSMCDDILAQVSEQQASDATVLPLDDRDTP